MIEKRYPFWWRRTFQIRTIIQVRELDSFRAALIVKGQNDFIIEHEHGIDEAINETLPLVLVVGVDCPELVQEITDLLPCQCGVLDLLF